MQISMFDGSHRFVINKPIRLIELFAGIGSQAKALKNLGVDFEHYRICEFDKYAVASYNAIHGTKFRRSDITKITAIDLGIVDTYKYCYILTYSFPCQDLSNAGKQAGMAKGSGTRSGLLWEVERLLDECQELPQVLVMENVPQVIAQGNIEHFAKWIEKLEKLGYKNKWEILNAKDFGIPQNRERCFMVSILGDYYYDFPKTIPLTLRLKDMLGKEVDEKYYLSEETINRIQNWKAQQDPLKDIEKEKLISPCSKARGAGEEHSGMVLISEPIIVAETDNHAKGGIYDINGIARTLLATEYKQPMQIVENPICGLIQPLNRNYKADGEERQETIEWRNDNLSGALRTGVLPVVKQKLKIRKLTPKECWRLMGFSDQDIEKAKAVGMSDTQLYKQAGNSIVVNVLMAIFEKMI